MPTRWTDYIDAAYRKIDIAAFHYEQLKIILGQYRGPFDSRPTIPIQAYFEGTIVATISAIDQVAQAANSSLNLHLESGNLFEGASKEIESRVSTFKAWREQPIGIDLRRLRTRIVHYSYKKSSNGDQKWHVEMAYENYTGARDLSSYAEATVAYGRELALIIGKLKESLEANNNAS